MTVAGLEDVDALHRAARAGGIEGAEVYFREAGGLLPHHGGARSEPRHLTVGDLVTAKRRRLAAHEGSMGVVDAAQDVVGGANELGPGDGEPAAGEAGYGWRDFLVAGRHDDGDFTTDAVTRGVEHLGTDG